MHIIRCNYNRQTEKFGDRKEEAVCCCWLANLDPM